jgi:hypothetical protein
MPKPVLSLKTYQNRIKTVSKPFSLSRPDHRMAGECRDVFETGVTASTICDGSRADNGDPSGQHNFR